MRKIYFKSVALIGVIGTAWLGVDFSITLINERNTLLVDFGFVGLVTVLLGAVAAIKSILGIHLNKGEIESDESQK